MSEWFYLQRWRAERRKTWVVVCPENKLCTPNGEFYDHNTAVQIAIDLKSKNKISYRVIHCEDNDYPCEFENTEGKNEDKRNEQC